METNQIITLISGAGIGAVLSAFLTFINSSKKNKLDFITKERSEWRKDIQVILDDLGKVGKRSEAIQRLKSRINPYGKNLTAEDKDSFYLHDGHIWRLIEKIDITNTEQVEELSDYVRLLWKYDWERSKYEIRFDIINSFIYFMLVVEPISNSLLILIKFKELMNQVMLCCLSVIMIFGTFCFKEFTKNIKNLTRYELAHLGLLALATTVSSGYMLYWIIPTSINILKFCILNLLVMSPIAGAITTIIFQGNGEEEKYIGTLKKIGNKENTHV
ncbi:hypothetical protein [Streptococcus salivarius]